MKQSADPKAKASASSLTEKEERAAEKQRRKEEKARIKQEKYYTASQWQLMGRKLVKHKLAMGSAVLLIILYLFAAFANFIAPQGLEDYSSSASNMPPPLCTLCTRGSSSAPLSTALR